MLHNIKHDFHLFFLLVTYFTTVTSASADWPMFHGTDGQNKSAETGLLKSWPEEGPKLIWKKTDLGKAEKVSGYSSVVISKGRIFTTANVDKTDASGESIAMLYCLDETTGKELWTSEMGRGWTESHEGERSTPTIDGNRVYIVTGYCQLHCFDITNGKPFWTRNLAADFDMTSPQYGYSQSVVIDGEKLMLGIGGQKASVVALDKTNGKTIWSTPPTFLEQADQAANSSREVERAAYGTANIFEQNGQKILAVMSQAGVLIVNVSRGNLLARIPFGKNANTGIPLYTNGKLLITAPDRVGSKLLNVSIVKGEVILTEDWTQKKLDTFHGGQIIHDGYIYGASQSYRGGVWLCVRLNDGEVMWESRKIPMGCCYYADGQLVLIDEREGNVVLLNPTPEKYDVVSQFTLPEEGQGNFWPHPVICNKRLYIRHDSFLYCYDIAKE